MKAIRKYKDGGKAAPSKKEYEENNIKRKKLKSVLNRPGMSEEAIKKTQAELDSLPNYTGFVSGEPKQKEESSTYLYLRTKKPNKPKG